VYNRLYPINTQLIIVNHNNKLFILFQAQIRDTDTGRDAERSREDIGSKIFTLNWEEKGLGLESGD